MATTLSATDNGFIIENSGVKIEYEGTTLKCFPRYPYESSDINHGGCIVLAPPSTTYQHESKIEKYGGNVVLWSNYNNTTSNYQLCINLELSSGYKYITYNGVTKWRV